MTVRFNLAGLAGALNDVDTASLHSANPGIGVSPAAGSELTGAPYSRQAIVFNAPVNNAGVAVSNLDADVTWPLALSGNIAANFIGLWKGAVYKGYYIPDTPGAFSGDATERSYTLEAEGTFLSRSNEA